MLTDQILLNIATDMSDAPYVRQLGAALNMSPSTVEKYIQNNRPDSSTTAYKIIEHWRDSEDNARVVYVKLVKSLKASHLNYIIKYALGDDIPSTRYILLFVRSTKHIFFLLLIIR